MTLPLEHQAAAASFATAPLNTAFTVSPAALDDALVGVLLNCISVPPRSRRRPAAVACVHMTGAAAAVGDAAVRGAARAGGCAAVI